MRSATVRLPGHPDAICDLLAEVVVDEYLRRDPESQVRCHVHGGAGALFVSGNVMSSADYDVSRVIQNALGRLGITESHEIFVALEVKGVDARGGSVPFKRGPVTVAGAAFAETPERIPETVSVARRAAKWLEEKRTSDPEWFWLGPDGDVTVIADKRAPSRLHVEVEHGARGLDDVRARIREGVRTAIGAELSVSVNAHGTRETRGLAVCSGASGQAQDPYGSLMPGMPNAIGSDPRAPEKAGTWLARHAARTLLDKYGGDAVFLRALYEPGQSGPSVVRAVVNGRSDPKPAEEARSMMNLSIVMRDWWQHGLNADAVQWGFAGEPGLPWEA